MTDDSVVRGSTVVRSAIRPRLVNPTIVRITARALLGRRRIWLLLPMPVVLVGIAMIGRLSDIPAAEWVPVVASLGFSVMLPLTALIVGTSVFGSEIDDGTIVHVLTKPVSRLEIVLSKLLVAFGVSTVTVAVPMAFAVADTARLGIGLAVGTMVGALAYSAVFCALSILSRRSVPIGLVYVLLWESTLTNFLSGTRVLSVQHFATAVADAVAASPLLATSVSTTVAIVMSAVFVVGGVLVATDRLRAFSVKGDTA